ncbi:hypothetical protein BATDEDRAFT_85941 [Batrachochytrium dendrobatidis JAM81]|uniref:CHCH domain-containing protein n=1 Tax=Batrachochytrium dendrobatidis (strain JAM81 / FGSC 10211) TaxID=684364 RepID=F4NT20_BATDJ|nr:uncharacterized protein BATDEDRAFT_85941 [Batrachochytrium dendrobatidis JAM81]EGF83485.1 hypothetical protein BATDEDRAFT_85941 [Batrachochytrium dendrobatidis JAM81]KAJ8327055.1 hypothetical protein O5D80_004479 [Batrachochytrium dendrobatidis]KAK5668034.1 hypothetical protein QVD99_005077 [Batrachochytrium dendrobatidis]|eukprot:XP_006676112.1 hypothetical protein BATDEDRAFT_85941 [Batrachochytrium dendrobatidis JAM81]
MPNIPSEQPVKPTKLLCDSAPLQACLEKHNGDRSKCLEEWNNFRSACSTLESKKLNTLSNNGTQ